MQVSTGSAQDEIVDLGLLPEEVMLRLGRPDAVPSSAWTPGLAEMSERQRDAVLAASDRQLRATGWLDEDGHPAGPLAPLAALVGEVDVVVRFETARFEDDHVASGALLVTAAQVLLLVHAPRSRSWAAQVMAPAVAVAALALGMDPFGLAASSSAAAAPRDVSLAELGDLVAGEHRRSTVRLVRVSVRDQPPTEALLTVAAQRDGVHVCGALRDGKVRVQEVDRDGLVDLALAVLGIGVPAAAAMPT